MSQTRPAALSKNIDNLQVVHLFGHPKYSKNMDNLMQHYPKSCYIHDNITNLSRGLLYS
jgi:hypothetical protein